MCLAVACRYATTPILLVIWNGPIDRGDSFLAHETFFTIGIWHLSIPLPLVKSLDMWILPQHGIHLSHHALDLHNILTCPQWHGLTHSICPYVMMTWSYLFKIETMMGSIGNMFGRVYVIKEKANLKLNPLLSFNLNSDYELEMRFHVDRNC